MEEYESEAHKLKWTLMEILGVIRKPKSSWFSSKSFLIFRGIQWMLLTLIVTSSLVFLKDAMDDFDKRKVAPRAAVVAFICSEMLLYSVMTSMIQADLMNMMSIDHKLISQIKNDYNNRSYLRVADKKSVQFTYGIFVLLITNIIISLAQASLKVFMTGKDHYPLELYCFGTSMYLCWFIQIALTSHAAIHVCYFCSSIKIFEYQLTSYVNIFSRMLKERVSVGNATDDKKLFSLYSDISNFILAMSKTYGAFGFIEIMLSTGRTCFACFHVQIAIGNQDYGNATGILTAIASSITVTYIVCACGETISQTNDKILKAVRESHWHIASPAVRKQLIPLLIMNQRTHRLHFRGYMTMNLKKFTDVLQTAYTLTTILANLI